MKVLVIGGTRYFGRSFVHHLISEGHQIWIISRGNMDDDFGARVRRLRVDRNDAEALRKSVTGLQFDAVVDQICMTAKQAEEAVSIFSDKTPYYLMTSTMSVYELGANLREEEFSPFMYQPKKPNSPAEDYAEGKRAAEKVFANQEFFQWAFARFPVVVGEDDYTKRLADQVRKIQEGKPLYFPNLNARFSFIHSQDAAKALLWMVHGHRQGPYNFASREAMPLGDMVKKIEAIVNKKAVLLSEPSEENWSPFGVSQDWYLNVDKAAQDGFEAQALEEWFEPLVKHLAGSK